MWMENATTATRKIKTAMNVIKGCQGLYRLTSQV